MVVTADEVEVLKLTTSLQDELTCVEAKFCKRSLREVNLSSLTARLAALGPPLLLLILDVLVTVLVYLVCRLDLG